MWFDHGMKQPAFSDEVIGGGSGGLAASKQAADLGAKVGSKSRSFRNTSCRWDKQKKNLEFKVQSSKFKVQKFLHGSICFYSKKGDIWVKKIISKLYQVAVADFVKPSPAGTTWAARPPFWPGWHKIEICLFRFF